MISENSIRKALEREIKKLVCRHNKRALSALGNRKRYKKRSGKEPKPSTVTPDWWDIHPHFNPYHVRSRLDSFSHSIRHKIENRIYEPNPTLTKLIPKPTGGLREISISSIPDAAVSYWLGHRLIQKNFRRFSPYAYAYRPDKNAHHAIKHLMTGIRETERIFAVKCDFAKYFDTINHDYLKRILDKNFHISCEEMYLINKLLLNPRAESITEYTDGIFKPRNIGIPQGSSSSLFLANVACFELDRELEQVGIIFARYVDDTLIICDSYEKANKCANLLIAHGDRSGTKVNFSKSFDISLLTKEKTSEIRQRDCVDFLSHSLSLNGISISDAAIARIKRRISKILYNNLLLQPKRGNFNPKRLGAGFHDWDLVTCVNDLRRYIYGRISEASLTNALTGTGKLKVPLCAMSFYPTIDEIGSKRLRELDGWLLDILQRTYKNRIALLATFNLQGVPIGINDLKSGAWYDYPDVSVETSLPSFYKSWLYVKKVSRVHGLKKFPSPYCN